MRIHGKRQATAAFAALLLAFAVTAPAHAADRKPSPARVAGALVYKAALANRQITLLAINESFTKAVKRAKKGLSAAMAKATTPSQKSSAAARFKDAINRATAIRQAELDSLPELPPQPSAKASAK